ncbi:MAG: DNA-binding protein [Planctomycetes bacterium]|nr:DNA-binding protein [Planctomycetota bacterium]
MGQLTVRNVDDEVVRALRVRAAHHGRSAEAEVREILRHALLPAAMSIEDFLACMPEGGEDRDFARIEGPFRDADL